MRRAAKVDANQAAVVAALEKVGCTVQSLAAVGTGVPDLLVGYHGKNFLLEIKDGTKPPSARYLTEDQIRWHNHWRGRVRIANSVAEALNLVGATNE